MKNHGAKGYENPFTGEVHGDFTWCLHCERVYKTDKWVKNGWDCPGEDCDGGILDASSWGSADWPKSENPDYPDVPMEGAEYPLYGRRRDR